MAEKAKYSYLLTYLLTYYAVRGHWFWYQSEPHMWNAANEQY